MPGLGIRKLKVKSLEIDHEIRILVCQLSHSYDTGQIGRHLIRQDKTDCVFNKVSQTLDLVEDTRPHVVVFPEFTQSYRHFREVMQRIERLPANVLVVLPFEHLSWGQSSVISKMITSDPNRQDITNWLEDVPKADRRLATTNLTATVTL